MHRAASKITFDEEVSKYDDRLLLMRDWKINSTEYPVLDLTFGASGANPFRILLNCEDWNDEPPSIVFLDIDGEPRSAITRDPAGIFNESAHPITRRPFVCTPGSKEYHTHTSHLTDHWSNYRNKSGFDLGGILTKLWRAWKTIPT